MSRRHGYLFGGGPAAACPDDRLVSMQVDLGLELVPQLVVFRPAQITTQQLDLLDSGAKSRW